MRTSTILFARSTVAGADVSGAGAATPPPPCASPSRADSEALLDPLALDPEQHGRSLQLDPKRVGDSFACVVVRACAFEEEPLRSELRVEAIGSILRELHVDATRRFSRRPLLRSGRPCIVVDDEDPQYVGDSV